MPNGSLPAAGYLGDGQRTTVEFQDGLDELLAYVRSLKAEVDALSATVIKEGAVRGVGNGAGLLADKAVLDARLGTTGNLGTAATKDFGTADGNLPAYSSFGPTSLGGSFTSGEIYGAKIGDIVTLYVTEGAHAAATGVFSGVVIPEDFRPSDNVSNVIYLGVQGMFQILIYPGGQIFQSAVNYSGSAVATNGMGNPYSISYKV